MTECPVANCGRTMLFENGAFYCTNPNHVHVVCSCGTRMIPAAHYHDGLWTFWRCPHCFKRW